LASKLGSILHLYPAPETKFLSLRSRIIETRSPDVESTPDDPTSPRLAATVSRPFLSFTPVVLRMAHFYIPIRSDPHHPGELFPRVGFIVTNLSLPSGSVVRFYNKRGLQFMGLYKFHGVRYRMVNEAVADSARVPAELKEAFPTRSFARRSVRDDSDDVVALALRPEVAGCDPLWAEAHVGREFIDLGGE
jgi:hypothetical protein